MYLIFIRFYLYKLNKFYNCLWGVVFMKPITKKMVRIYKCVDDCWLGYKITKSNYLTFHHIKKAEHGGLYTLDNGALITNIGHNYLHTIEYKDLEIYLRLNQFMKAINEQGHAPTKKQYILINDCLKY